MVKRSRYKIARSRVLTPVADVLTECMGVTPPWDNCHPYIATFIWDKFFGNALIVIVYHRKWVWWGSTWCHIYLLNKFDCLSSEERIEWSDVITAVSIVHQCSKTCKFLSHQVPLVVERETVLQTSLIYKHDQETFTKCPDYRNI